MKINRKLKKRIKSYINQITQELGLSKNIQKKLTQSTYTNLVLRDNKNLLLESNKTNYLSMADLIEINFSLGLLEAKYA